MTNINKNNSEHQTIYSKCQPKYRIVITLPSTNIRLIQVRPGTIP